MNHRDIVIKAENLSKRYRIGIKEKMHENLSESVIDFIRRPIKNYKKYRSLYRFDDVDSALSIDFNEESLGIMWALRDVTFKVKKGDLIGIIGSNGSGKSTLLKILSKIIEPTNGRAEIQGRVASLLEVGTGFHPELTGRENVYLNGTILGMKKKEIDSKFDEILAFSGVEKFIDTPVKRYSSGMHVRLAFSVAAHLEPDILLVDEVLAVGDASFQQKCMGKMGEVVKGGRTIILVSHNMGAIENLCSTAIWINDGKIMANGDVTSTVNSYLRSAEDKNSKDKKTWKHHGSGEATIEDIKLFSLDGQKATTFKMSETIIIDLSIEFGKKFDLFDDMAISIKNSNTSQKILHLIAGDTGFQLRDIYSGKKKIRIEVPKCMLYPGLYQISVWIGYKGDTIDEVNDAVDFNIVQGAVSKRSRFYSKKGVYYQPSVWKEM